MADEYATLQPRGTHPTDWWTCVCGNEPHFSGFYTSTPTGMAIEPDADGPWDGVHSVCAECLRVIDQNTGRVVARATDHHTEEELRHALANV